MSWWRLRLLQTCIGHSNQCHHPTGHVLFRQKVISYPRITDHHFLWCLAWMPSLWLCDILHRKPWMSTTFSSYPAVFLLIAVWPNTASCIIEARPLNMAFPKYTPIMDAFFQAHLVNGNLLLLDCNYRFLKTCWSVHPLENSYPHYWQFELNRFRIFQHHWISAFGVLHIITRDRIAQFRWKLLGDFYNRSPANNLSITS